MSESVFKGLKVADFSWVGVGPISMRYLADYGATVVHIESETRPDFLRRAEPFKDGIAGLNRSAFFANYNGGKLGVSLNLKHPKGIDVAKRFIAWADIVAESFTAGTMGRMGLDYEAAREVNPHVIYFSSTNQGQTGPYAAQPGFGTQLVSLAGFVDLIGWADREPAGTGGAYTDFISPKFSVAVIAAALEYRRRTGHGLCIDLSQLEVGMQFLAPQILDYTANGHLTHRDGNRRLGAAPHNAYPCRGDDRWCVITVTTDAHWLALKSAMGRPAWADEACFGTLLGRKRNEDRLDGLVGEWTQRFGPHDLMQKLHEAGVPAGVVQSSGDLFTDPQLSHRKHFAVRRHAEIGDHAYDNFPIRLSASPGETQGPAPCLGQDNGAVYSDILGMSADEIAELIIEGVLV